MIDSPLVATMVRKFWPFPRVYVKIDGTSGRPLLPRACTVTVASPATQLMVIGRQAAFIEQLFDIAERERAPKIPAHRANNQFRSRLSPLEDRRSGCSSHALSTLPTAARDSCNTSPNSPM